MKTVTVREAQHNFARILEQVEAGESIEILRRKTPVARLVPIALPNDEGEPVEWKGHADRMGLIWGGAPIATVGAVLDDLRADRR